MRQDPLQAMQAALRVTPSTAARRLLIAGATGALGNEVLRRLAGSSVYASTQVLAREPVTEGMRNVQTLLVAGEDPQQWPAARAGVGVVLFDPPRLFYERERALWTPTPEQLPPLARWMRASGVRTLAIVLPHAPGRLPEALKRGLATLDEHAVASLGFERLLIVRSARKPEDARQAHPLARLAHWMLGVFKYMVPSTEQPVRAVKVAELLSLALRRAPPGIHVAPPELVWQASQGAMDDVVRRWLAEPSLGTIRETCNHAQVEAPGSQSRR